MTAGLDVVGIAASTPLGHTAQATAAAVRAGIAGFGEFPFVTASGEPVIVCADDDLDSGLEGRARLAPMIERVLDRVLESLAHSEALNGACYLLLILPEPRPGFSDADASWVADVAGKKLRAGVPHARVGVAARGHAGTMRAVERVAQEAANGVDGLFLIVGADSYHHPETFMWLERDRRFAQPGVRAGFIPGEGAGCLALASQALARRLGLPALATVSGVGTSQESLLRDSETGSFGRGMSQAITAATHGLRLPGEAVDVVYADINGERYRSEEWGFAAMNTYAAMKSLEYELPGACWGDVGAAFGTLASILAVQSYVRGYAKGPRALVMAGSDSGLRGAMVLQGPVSR